MTWKIDFIRSDSSQYKNTSEYTCIVTADDSVTAVEIAKERVSKLNRQIKYDYCYYICIDNDNNIDVVDGDSSYTNNSDIDDIREKIEQRIDEYLERYYTYTKDAIDTGYNLQDLLSSDKNKKKDGKSINTARRKKIKLVILYTVLIVVTAMLSAGLTTVMLRYSE